MTDISTQQSTDQPNPRSHRSSGASRPSPRKERPRYVTEFTHNKDLTALQGQLDGVKRRLEAGFPFHHAAKAARINKDELLQALGLTDTATSDQVIAKLVALQLDISAELGTLRADHDDLVVEHARTRRYATANITSLRGRVLEIEELIGSDAFLAALEASQRGGGKSFLQALRARQVSDEQIAETLIIMRENPDEPIDFSDSDMFAELFGSYQTLHEEMTRVTPMVDAHERILGPDGQNFRSLRQQVTTISAGSKLSGGWIVAALIAGVIAGLLWASHTFTEVTKTTQTTGGVKTTSTSVSFAGWDTNLAAILFGLLVALCVIALGVIVTSRRKTTETTTEIHETNQATRRPGPVAAFRRSYTEARNNRTTASDDIVVNGTDHAGSPEPAHHA